MQRIRIFAAGAIMALALAGSAVAQASDQSGGPPAPLAGLKPPPETKAHMTKPIVHAKTAHHSMTAASKRSTKMKLASKKSHTIAATQPQAPAAQPTPAALPDNAWPVPEATPPAEIATASPPQATVPDNDPDPSAVVVGGQTVQVATPDQVNDIDLAAADNSVATTKADAAPVSQTVLAAPLHRDADAVRSVSWIAQVLAALGGSAAAGAVAWFLIGSGPVRIYG